MSAELRAAVSMICGPPRSSPPPEASSAAKSSSSSSKLRDAWTSFSASKSSGRGTSPHTLEAWVTCSRQREIYRGQSLCEERLHPVLYVDPGREEGKQKLKQETGSLWSVYFCHLLSLRGLFKSLHAHKSSRHQYGQSSCKFLHCTNVWRNHSYLILCVFQSLMVEAGNRYSQLTTMTHIWIHTQVRANNHIGTLWKPKGKPRSEWLDDTNLFKYTLNSVPPG